MKLVYTPQAIEDIAAIKSYIELSLRNKSAAKNIAEAILQSCARLKDFPRLGFSVRERYGFESEDRILLCENYVVLYSLRQDRVAIDRVAIGRVIDARCDYARILWGKEEPK